MSITLAIALVIVTSLIGLAEKNKVAFTILVIIACSLVGYDKYDSNQDDKKKEKIFDSTLTAKNEEATRRITDSIKKYLNAAEEKGLKWDSAKNDFIETPVLSLSNVEVLHEDLDRIEFKLLINSANAASSNVNIIANAVVELKNGNITSIKGTNLSRPKILQGRLYPYLISFHIAQDAFSAFTVEEIRNIFIQFTGTYSNSIDSEIKLKPKIFGFDLDKNQPLNPITSEEKFQKGIKINTSRLEVSSVPTATYLDTSGDIKEKLEK